MKHAVFTFSLVILITAAVFGQKNMQPTNADLRTDTRIAAQLQSTLDVKRVNPGDQVVLKTTQAVKQNGHVVVEKGSKLFGHITEIQQKTKANASSKIGVLFDHMQNAGGAMMPITATITSITQARTAASINNDAEADTYSSSSSGASTSPSGGLLGGVGNTVAGVAGSVVNATTQTVGHVAVSTVNTVGTNIRGLSISQAADAEAQSGSTLSLTGGNLKLEQGTTFNLNVSQSAGVTKN